MIETIQTKPRRIIAVPSIGKRTAGLIGTTKDALADLIADGLEVPEACQRLGLAKSAGYKYLAEMKAELGAQAA